MEFNELIARINFLYHKKHDEGLTTEEQEEKARLYREYMDTIKGNFKSQLERIEWVDREDNRADEDGGCGGGCGCHCEKH